MHVLSSKVVPRDVLHRPTYGIIKVTGFCGRLFAV